MNSMTKFHPRQLERLDAQKEQLIALLHTVPHPFTIQQRHSSTLTDHLLSISASATISPTPRNRLPHAPSSPHIHLLNHSDLIFRRMAETVFMSRKMPPDAKDKRNSRKASKQGSYPLAHFLGPKLAWTSIRPSISPRCLEHQERSVFVTSTPLIHKKSTRDTLF